MLFLLFATVFGFQLLLSTEETITAYFDQKDSLVLFDKFQISAKPTYATLKLVNGSNELIRKIPTVRFKFNLVLAWIQCSSSNPFG